MCDKVYIIFGYLYFSFDCEKCRQGKCDHSLPVLHLDIQNFKITYTAMKMNLVLEIQTVKNVPILLEKINQIISLDMKFILHRT